MQEIKVSNENLPAQVITNNDQPVMTCASNNAIDNTSIISAPYVTVMPTGRDKRGLLEKVDYKFNEDGSINWRAMIKSEFLKPNKEKTSETDISKLSDSELIILIGGIKELAQIRGYTDVEYEVTCPSPDYVLAVCKIKWIPNFETMYNSVAFSAIGDASLYNCNEMGRKYLGATAENRAFVRCVRNFLKINIVGKDEIGGQDIPAPETPKSEEPSIKSIHVLLNEQMEAKGITFKQLKARLIEDKFKNAEEISCIEDIPKKEAFKLVGRIKSYKKMVK